MVHSLDSGRGMPGWMTPPGSGRQRGMTPPGSAGASTVEHSRAQSASSHSGRGMTPPGSGGSGTRGGVRVAALLGRLEAEIETLRKSDARHRGTCSFVTLG